MRLAAVTVASRAWPTGTASSSSRGTTTARTKGGQVYGRFATYDPATGGGTLGPEFVIYTAAGLPQHRDLVARLRLLDGERRVPRGVDGPGRRARERHPRPAHQQRRRTARRRHPDHLRQQLAGRARRGLQRLGEHVLRGLGQLRGREPDRGHSRPSRAGRNGRTAGAVLDPLQRGGDVDPQRRQQPGRQQLPGGLVHERRRRRRTTGRSSAPTAFRSARRLRSSRARVRVCYASYDGFSIAHNTSTNTYIAVLHGRGADDVGTEILPTGVPTSQGIFGVTDAGARKGNYYPKIAASTHQRQVDGDHGDGLPAGSRRSCSSPPPTEAAARSTSAASSASADRAGPDASTSPPRSTAPSTSPRAWRRPTAWRFKTYYQIANANDMRRVGPDVLREAEHRRHRHAEGADASTAPARSRTTVDLAAQVGNGPWSAVFQSLTADAPVDDAAVGLLGRRTRRQQFGDRGAHPLHAVAVRRGQRASTTTSSRTTSSCSTRTPRPSPSWVSTSGRTRRRPSSSPTRSRRSAGTPSTPTARFPTLPTRTSRRGSARPTASRPSWPSGRCTGAPTGRAATRPSGRPRRSRRGCSPKARRRRTSTRGSRCSTRTRSR